MFTPLLLTIALVQMPPLGPLTGTEAKAHIGEEATVCGFVASTRYLDTSDNRATFLNFDKPNPNQTFTVVIFGDHRDKFDRPEVRYKDKQICVTGRIAEFRGTPQIIATELRQIKEGPPAPTRIHSSEVANYVGAELSVCGFVAETQYDQAADGKPTFLYFGKPSPDHTFTAVIYDDVRSKFRGLEVRYRLRNICVSGKIEKSPTSIRMVLTDPKQITFLQ